MPENRQAADAPIGLVGAGETAQLISAMAGEAGSRLLAIEGWPAPAGLELVGNAMNVPGHTVVVDDRTSPDLDTRAQHVAELAAALPEAVVVAVCTETTPITDLARLTSSASRLVGLRIARAVDPPRLAELIPGVATADTAVEILKERLDLVDLECVVAPDRPGFLVDALLRPYLNQVVQALDDNIATAGDIDRAIELGLGYRVGPLALLDRLGLDEHERVAQALHEMTGEPHLAPPALLRRMVTAGWTSRSTERGFTVGKEAGQ